MTSPQSEIKFHKENENWGEFSNYYPAKIRVWIPRELNLKGEVISEKGYLPIGELEFSSSEALFHALKFTQEGKERLDIINQIKSLDPDNSKELARQHDKTGYDTENWWFNGWNDKVGGYCIRAMKWVVREKFKQNPDLQKILLGTGNAKLIENTQIAKSYNDEFWGNGNGKPYNNGRPAKYPAGGGENQLGKILMEIRTELQQKAQNNQNPPNSKNDNNEPPKPNQKEQDNPPTNNDDPVPKPINNNDNPEPEKSDNSPTKNPDNPQPSGPTTDTPPIDTDRINNAENPEQAQQEAQVQIQKLFTTSKVKPNELDKSLWKNKSNWEEYLKELRTIQEIADFAQLLERKIKEKQQQKANQGRNKTNSPNKPNPSNKMLIFSLGGGILLVILIFSTLIFRKRKLINRRRKSR